MQRCQIVSFVQQVQYNNQYVTFIDRINHPSIVQIDKDLLDQGRH